MYEIKFAIPYMENGLKYLYKRAFPLDSSDIVNAFFERCVSYDNCLVVLDENRVASALYFFCAKICLNGKKIPAYYIYAVGTLPEYRNKGFVTLLLNQVRKVAAQRNIDYLFLLPQTEKLYTFYEKRGFCRFFKKCEYSISRTELSKYSKNGTMNVRFDLSSEKYNQIRKVCFSNDGNILWDNKHFKYSVFLNENSHGFMILSENGYAMCSKPENNCVYISELVVLPNDFCNLMANIYESVICDMYIFRTSQCQRFFSEQCVVSDQGMILCVDGHENIVSAKDPYLGLAME